MSPRLPSSPVARAALALAPALALPLALLADALIARSLGWQPRELGRWIVPVCGGLLALGGLALAAPPSRRTLARRAPEWILAGGAFLLAVVAADLVAGRFRIVAQGELTHLRPPGTELVYRPIPGVMPGVEGESHYRINGVGVRGDEMPSDPEVPLVLCVGGSTTECLYLDQSEAWPQLLQEDLRARGERVWVGNAGVSGYATPWHLRFVRVSRLVREANVLVFLVGINDLLWELGGRDFDAIPTRAARIPEPVALRTALGRLAVATWQRLAYGVDDLVVEDRTGANYAERRRVRRESGAREEIELPLDALVGWGKRLDEIISACRDAGVRPILLTQPTLWRDDPPPEIDELYWMGDRRGVFATPGSLRHALDAYGELLVRLAARRGVECLDLRDMSGDPHWFYDDCHFNEAGAAEVATRLAAYLARTGLGRRPRSETTDTGSSPPAPTGR